MISFAERALRSVRGPGVAQVHACRVSCSLCFTVQTQVKPYCECVKMWTVS